MVLQAALEDDFARWREKGMGISLDDLQADCLSILRFACDVLLFSASLEQLGRMMRDFGEKYRKRRTENPPGQDENSQQPQSRVFAIERTCEVSRSNNNFRATGDN